MSSNNFVNLEKASINANSKNFAANTAMAPARTNLSLSQNVEASPNNKKNGKNSKNIFSMVTNTITGATAPVMGAVS